jgi:hypothetical protein
LFITPLAPLILRGAILLNLEKGNFGKTYLLPLRIRALSFITPLAPLILRGASFALA